MNQFPRIASFDRESKMKEIEDEAREQSFRPNYAVLSPSLHSLLSKATFGKGSQPGRERTPVAWQVAALCRKLGIVQPQDMQLTMDALGALDSLHSQVWGRGSFLLARKQPSSVRKCGLAKRGGWRPCKDERPTN